MDCMCLQERWACHPSDGLIRQWSLLNQDERQHYGQLARAENAQAKALGNLPQADDVEHVGGILADEFFGRFPHVKASGCGGNTVPSNVGRRV